MRSTQPEDTKWGSAGPTAFDRLLIPCRAEPPSRAAWPRERKNVAMERLSNGQAQMRLDGAKKSQDACQDLISWENAGPAVVDLGLLRSSFVFRVCRELAHPPTVAGPQAGRLPPEEGPRRGGTKRLGASRAISLGLRSCTRGGRTAKEGSQAGQSMADAWQRQGEVGRKNVMSEL